MLNDLYILDRNQRNVVNNMEFEEQYMNVSIIQNK